MNFWRKGVGWEWIFVIARSLELQALPYALNRPPRAAASFNPGLEVLRRGSHETTEGLPPDQREWAGRLAVGEAPEAGLLGEPSWAGGIGRDSGNRQRSKARLEKHPQNTPRSAPPPNVGAISMELTVPLSIGTKTSSEHEDRFTIR